MRHWRQRVERDGMLVAEGMCSAATTTTGTAFAAPRGLEAPRVSALLITHDPHPVRLLPEKRHPGYEPAENSARKCRQTMDRTPRLQGQTAMFPQHELRT